MENNAIISLILKLSLKIIYFPLKVLPQKNKVIMISREFNEPNEDFLLLQNEIKSRSREASVLFLCKTMGKSLKEFVLYWFYLVKCCYHLATAKVCVVDTYCIPVSVLHHKKNLKVIQIWHALGAIKKFGYQTIGLFEGSNEKTAKNMCMHKNYDLITCASQKTKEFYSEAFKQDTQKIAVIGMPRIDLILKPEPELKEKFLNDYPKFSDKKIILYVPTFRKGEEVNYKPLSNIDKSRFALIVKPHILSESGVDNEFLVKNYSTLDLMKISDYIITDYSAVSFEAALLNKPLYFYLYDIDNYSNNRGLNIDIAKEMKSSSFKNADDLIKSIENSDYNFSELNNFKEKYIETADRNNSKRITDYIFNSGVK